MRNLLASFVMILGIDERILVKVLCNLFPNYDFISPYPMRLLSIKLILFMLA